MASRIAAVQAIEMMRLLEISRTVTTHIQSMWNSETV
jgi:hypothetical protein